MGEGVPRSKNASVFIQSGPQERRCWSICLATIEVVVPRAGVAVWQNKSLENS